MCDCQRDRLWVRFPLEEMKYLIPSLPCSSKEHGMPTDFIGMCLNTRLGYNMNLKNKLKKNVGLKIVILK